MSQIKVSAPSGGWYAIWRNGSMIALVKSEHTAEIIAANLRLREMLGHSIE